MLGVHSGKTVLITLLGTFLFFSSCKKKQGGKNSLGIKMVTVPAGSFYMGDTVGNFDEAPVHEVIISQAFSISRTEIPAKLFAEFKKDYRFAGEEMAIGVSWYDAMEFCKWLSEKDGKYYRLPSEAEWEYVCRMRDRLEVKNMLDSTLEWCSDWYGPYPYEKITDPVGVANGFAKVVRGGLPDDFVKLYTYPKAFYSRESNRSGMAPGFDGFVVPAGNSTDIASEIKYSDVKSGMAGIVFDDLKMKNPLMRFPVSNLNSEKAGWLQLNNFAARWVGTIEAPFSGDVTFSVRCDSQISIEIDNQILINEKKEEQPVVSGTFKMTKGKKYPIRIKYIHNEGSSYLQLFWSWQGQKQQIVPAESFSHAGSDLKEIEKEYKQGVFARYVRPTIGFRIVEGPALKTRTASVSAKFIHDCIKQLKLTTDLIPEKPYFRKRFLHSIPPGKSTKEEIILSGLSGYLGGHNHHSAPVVCPNGDLLVVYFSAEFEDDPEVCLMASRLRYGAEQWDMPEPIMDLPDVNDVSPLFWRDGNKIYLFWGNIHLHGGYPFQWIESDNNGETFSEVKYPLISSVADGYCPQPITSIFKDEDGKIYLASDGVGAKSFLWASEDGGQSWHDTGGRTGGRHTAIVPLKNGNFYGVGGKKSDINGFMPISVSKDKGKSWTVSQSIFPALGGGQRPALIRLKSRNLLYAGDFESKEGYQPEGIKEVGAFVALSSDEGKKWKVKKIPGTMKSVKEETAAAMKGGTIGYVSLVQSDNGMIHMTTSENAPALHFEFNEAWILSDSNLPDDNRLLMKSSAKSIANVQVFEERYVNGKLKYRCSGGFSNNRQFLLHGKETWYYERGNLKYQADYRLGKKVGVEKYYSDNGITLWEKQFDETGFTWVKYWENGNKKSESHWKNRRCDGIARMWNPNGKLIGEDIFVDGKIIN